MDDICIFSTSSKEFFMLESGKEIKEYFCGNNLNPKVKELNSYKYPEAEVHGE